MKPATVKPQWQVFIMDDCLGVQHLAGGTDIIHAGLLDVPFVQTGQTHGNTLPAEQHSTFNFNFSAHMEGPDLGEAGFESSDDGSLYAAANQNLRSGIFIPQLQQLSNGFHAKGAAAGGAAGQHRVDAQFLCSQISPEGIPGDIDWLIEASEKLTRVNSSQAASKKRCLFSSGRRRKVSEHKDVTPLENMTICHCDKLS